MSNTDESEELLVNRVIEVTACNAAEAKHFLSACANDVEAAVALFFEQGTGSVADADGGVVIPVEEEEVRAPIAPIREQLIGPDDDDNFFGSAPPAGRLARVAQRVKICPLRDFAREGALMEEQLQAAGNFMPNLADQVGATHSRSRRRERAGNMVTAAQAADRFCKPSSSRLGDLFRPPTDLLYTGSFHAARTCATKRKQWLLVNVQSDNFESQLLNRDVWSDKPLRKLIQQQFLLWQVDSESSEGRRFVAFYHCAKLPYVCVIDPRTGEEVWRAVESNQINMLTQLQQFLQEHDDFSELAEDAPSTSKRHITINVDDDDDDEDDDKKDDEASCSSGSSSQIRKRKRAKLTELSEEEQIALAIRNSMAENGKAAAVKKQQLLDDDDDSGSAEEFADEDSKSACERTAYEEKLGSNKDELTMIKLRLFNTAGSDEVVQLRWPSDTRLEVLRLYVAQTHIHIPKDGYKLICAFPRKMLEVENNGSTLKELGLHPSANIHLTLDD